MDNNIKIFLGVIGILIVGVIATAVLRSGGAEPAPGVYDTFARCLKDKGATFYGAFWCPHCKAQKKMFGTSAKFLPYVECSTLDGKSQLQVCIDKNVSSYPTWELADGTRLPNESGSGISLETLSEKTSCPLPGSEPAPLPIEAGGITPVQ